MKRLFAIDLRFLAAFRIALGLLLIADLLDRARDLTAHYTDLGVLPREALRTVFYNPYTLTFHTLGGTPAFTAALFVIAGLFAVLLVLGRWTRVATVVSWIFLVSLQHRNWFVLYGGDLFLRMMLFWGMFLPWGERFSLDARRSRTKDPAESVSSVASAGLLLQVCFVYFFTGLLKAKNPAWQEGLGVYYALTLDTHARALGTWLLGFPELVHALSHGTLLLELLGPIALLASYRTPRLRGAVIGAFLVFQAGLGFCLSLGLFPWISSAGLIPFLPGRSDFLKGQARWAQALCLFCLACVFLWNVGTVVALPFRDSRLWAVPRVLALNQGWVMFVNPRVTDGWYVIPGLLEDGSSVDLFNRSNVVRWKRPKRISATFKDLRWAKYMSNLWDAPPLRPYFAWYLCHGWNTQNGPGKQLREFEIVYMLELTRPDNPQPPAEKIPLGNYTCTSN